MICNLHDTKYTEISWIQTQADTHNNRSADEVRKLM